MLFRCQGVPNMNPKLHKSGHLGEFEASLYPIGSQRRLPWPKKLQKHPKSHPKTALEPRSVEDPAMDLRIQIEKRASQSIESNSTNEKAP